ncbi:hypothetical protein ACEWY4_000134 [Coilia grayii]|uniref:Small integral membrane protein 1 n=1 Tax=Coilia grayii TaxID=363190 RepID=A0ABD1KW85_9TELE
MEAEDANVSYSRWNEDVNLSSAQSQSSLIRFYNRLCTGNLGIYIRIAGAVAALVSVYILGYVTGYYVHGR